MTGYTGMLGELVGSHTKVAIYPTYAICSDTGFKGIKVVKLPA